MDDITGVIFSGLMHPARIEGVVKPVSIVWHVEVENVGLWTDFRESRSPYPMIYGDRGDGGARLLKEQKSLKGRSESVQRLEGRYRTRATGNANVSIIKHPARDDRGSKRLLHFTAQLFQDRGRQAPVSNGIHLFNCVIFYTYNGKLFVE